MNLNVLTDFPYRKSYYLTHPWKFFKELYWNARNGWRRMTRGYCGMDKWNFDNWFLEIVPNMLDDLADNACGYPGNDEFPTPESWSTFLHNLANDLRLCTEEAADKMNEYYEDYLHSFESDRLTEEDEDGNLRVNLRHTPEGEEIAKKYFARCKEIEAEQEAIREEAFARLGRVLPLIWD